MPNGTRDRSSSPVVVVSLDSHVGPRLVEDLRPYCPPSHQERFDELVETHLQGQDTAAAIRHSNRAHPNMGRPGHYEATARLADMDYDGVAAEVIYHGSQNGEPIPWVPFVMINEVVRPEHFGLVSVGYHIYNQWLADFCAADPERLIGLAYLPTWDIEAAVRELTWAREHGLRAVNLPPPNRPGHLEYNNLAWEPFWSAAEDLGISFHTHASGASHVDYTSGPGAFRIFLHEIAGYMSRRAVWWMVLGEVFERHPKLRLVETEQTEAWFLPTMHEMDSVYLTLSRPLAGSLPRMPSEYMRDNVFYGASFPSRAEVESASRDEWWENLLWGRDYPHLEGTYLAIDDPDAEPFTKRALRHVFHGIPTEKALGMVGGNAVDVLGLDGDYLATVAKRVGAITVAQLDTPLAEVPDVGSFAFTGYSGARPLEPYRIEWAAKNLTSWGTPEDTAKVMDRMAQEQREQLSSSP